MECNYCLDHLKYPFQKCCCVFNLNCGAYVCAVLILMSSFVAFVLSADCTQKEMTKKTRNSFKIFMDIVVALTSLALLGVTVYLLTGLVKGRIFYIFIWTWVARVCWLIFGVTLFVFLFIWMMEVGILSAAILFLNGLLILGILAYFILMLMSYRNNKNSSSDDTSRRTCDFRCWDEDPIRPHGSHKREKKNNTEVQFALTNDVGDSVDIRVSRPSDLSEATNTSSSKVSFSRFTSDEAGNGTGYDSFSSVTADSCACSSMGET